MRSKTQGSATPLYDPQAAVDDYEYFLSICLYSCGLDPSSTYTIEEIVDAITAMYPKSPFDGISDNLDIEQYEPVYLFTQKYRVSLLRSSRRVWRWLTMSRAQV